MLGQPGAICVDLGALASDSDGGRVLDFARRHLVKPAEPADHGFRLSGDKRIQAALGTRFPEMVLDVLVKTEVKARPPR
jgi:hypothetical protein